MRLAAWLEKQGEKKRDFAARCGLSAAYVSQLCADPPAFWPSRDVIARIRDATDGAVTANDFMAETAP